MSIECCVKLESVIDAEYSKHGKLAQTDKNLREYQGASLHQAPSRVHTLHDEAIGRAYVFQPFFKLRLLQNVAAALTSYALSCHLAYKSLH